MATEVGSFRVAIGADIRGLQEGIDRANGIIKSGAESITKSAKASSRVFEEARASADRLLGSVDPLYAAQVRYDKELNKAQQLFAKGALTANEFAKVQTGLKVALDSATGSVQGFHKANGMARIGQMELGHAARSTAEMIALGQSPLRAIALEMGRVTQGVGFLAGGTSKFASFLGGPWGIAITAATLALAPLLAKLFETKNELGDLVEKLRKQAQQAALNEEAERAWKSSLEGVKDALAQNKKSLDELADGEKSKARQDLEAALAAKTRASRIIDETQANLDLARSLYEVQKARAGGPGQRGEIAALGLEGALGTLDSLQSRLATSRGQLAEANRQIEEATSQIIKGAATRSPVEEITRRYDRLIEGARKRAVEEHKVGDELIRQIAALEKQKQAAIKAEEERNRKHPEGAKELANFIMPVQGPVTSGFGTRTAPTKGASTFHPAIDIGAPIGTPVKAAAGGVVITAGRMGGLGNVVIVDHGGGTISEYGHLSSILAQRGDTVGQGDIIGKVGSTGISTGPHLDYRVRVGGRYVDPRKGAFPVDSVAAGQLSMRDAESAAAKAKRAAEEAQRQQDSFTEARERLNGQILQAQDALSRGIEAQAKTAAQQVISEQDRNELAIKNDLAEGRYGDATSEVAKARAQQLIDLNNAVALQRLSNIQQQKIEALDEVAFRLADERKSHEIETLKYQDEIATTQEEHRRAQLAILDAVYEQKRLELEHEKQLAIRNGATQNEIDAIQGKLDDLGNQKGQDAERVRRGTMGPLEEWAKSIPQTASQVNAALQSIETEGLDGLSDAIAGVITGTESLKQAFGDLAKSIIADIIRMSVRMLIFRAISGILGGGSGGGWDAAGFGNIVSGNNAALGANLPGLAGGGSLRILGNSGTDRNIMAINGVPVARVDQGERISIANDNVNNPASSTTVTIVPTPYFDAHVDGRANVQIANAYPAFRAGAVQAVSERGRRR